ncbi:hypothetical protein RFI_22884 [Reticulomyxa filosa]|uniref:Uncharacterized protein n=1 Tax=Reticulomyxa filosa TaxID=46433 RepID=X6MLG9_RETFI|nr:hypothetical protein RFI_22884 [Reticulomyxa filosa]|eukprot:ETO14481.1 hypothetical protein RFI_22884 [Reticulomyxa filosa]
MAINGLYCVSQHMTAYVMKDDEANSKHMSKLCVLSANDGVQNHPMCYCCEHMEEWFASNDKSLKKNLTKLVCNDLWKASQCPPLFDSSLLMTWIITEQFKLGKVVQPDPFCPYGYLARSVYGSGCELFPKTGTVVVVGGRQFLGHLNRSPHETFTNTVQICYNNGQSCHVSKTLRFPNGIAYPTVVVLDDECLFLVLGGYTADGPTRDIWVGDLCTELWLFRGRNALPQEMVEFGLVKTDHELCLLGGQIQTPDEMFDLDDKVYCVPAMISAAKKKNNKQFW